MYMYMYHCACAAINNISLFCLSQNNLIDVIAAINLSARIVRRIKANFIWAVIYNIIGIPLAAGFLVPVGVTLQPWMASAAIWLSPQSVWSLVLCY